MTDTYEGWPNRETWAVNLHLANDEPLYRMATYYADTAWRDARGDRDAAIWSCSAMFRTMVTTFADVVALGQPISDAARVMVAEIGDLDAVVWHAVAADWITTAAEDAAR